ncbi:MAG: hypothetical protein KatS3mg031_0942 [Chitinophagales bacterium]|nr:MAG: hypothetical protein KatS3mg031_0942 [Chitinophagales bacterium]
MVKPERIIIRVYGLLIENHHILLLDEIASGMPVTKFPGGGLEPGEGPADCLVREFKEELGLDIVVKEHFYTTDFFQRSAFNPRDQLISIYYLVNRLNDFNPAHKLPINDQEILLQMKWVNLNVLNEDSVTLPVDKVVVRKLKAAYSAA